MFQTEESKNRPLYARESTVYLFAIRGRWVGTGDTERVIDVKRVHSYSPR